jgi:type IV pilus assembly protein PilN
MYSIDINFLNDRNLGDLQVDSKKTVTPVSERVPIFIGAGVAVALIGLSGGALLFLNGQKANIEQQNAELSQKISQLRSQNEEVNKIQSEIDNTFQETEALVSVFNNIKPWSALLAEISSIIPPNVQIESISQSQGKTINIQGFAKSYDDVNDFLLTLKQSKFLNSEKTRINTSAQTDLPQDNQNNSDSDEANRVTIEWPQVINYNITTELSEIPASELMDDLQRRGAIGLVSRMRTLEQKGAIRQ